MSQAQFKSMYFPILILNFSRLGRTSGEIKDVRDLRMSEVQRLRKTHKIIGRHIVGLKKLVMFANAQSENVDRQNTS